MNTRSRITTSWLRPSAAALNVRALAWDPTRPLYKYVDDPQFVKRGSLRIGTLRGYGGLENERADSGEFRIDGYIKYASSRDPDFAITAYNMNMPPPPSNATGEVIFANCVLSTGGPDMNCFCTSYDGNIEVGAARYQHVFEIKSVQTLLRRLFELQPDLGMPTISLVEYGSRYIDATKAPLEPNACLKPTSYSWEKEVRVLWPDNKNVRVIDLPDDPIIGDLFTPFREPIEDRPVR